MLIRFRAKGRIFQAAVIVPVEGGIIENGQHLAVVEVWVNIQCGWRVSLGP